MARAARYAAVALAQRPSDGADGDALTVLHDDLALVLAEMSQLVTGLGVQHQETVRVSELASHPVKIMLNQLHAMAHPGRPVEHREPPSQRWAGRPESPAAVTDPRGAWKGLAVEAFLARHALESDDRPLTNTRAWTVLGDVAALAETLAVGKRDLFTHTGSGAEHTGRARAILASLAVEAREVARLAAVGASTADRAVPGTANARGVITVPRSSRLPDAVENLAHILDLDDASAPDLLAVTRVLAQTSRAAAAVLNTAAAAPQAGIPDHLRASADVLLVHSDRLAEAVTAYQTKLGSMSAGSPLLIAQAREIGAIAVPRLRSLAHRPTEAEAASPDLLRYTEVIAGVTDAVHAKFTALDSRREILLRDRSEDAPHGWRRPDQADLAHLTGMLNQAAAAARNAPAPIRTRSTPPVPAATIAAAGAVLDLQRALLHRQSQVRPHRPATSYVGIDYRPPPPQP
ncbi:hypothetical protein V2J63_11830 [Georgenia sp. MJ278]